MTRSDRPHRGGRALGVIILALGVRALLYAEPACISRDGVHFVTFARQLADDPIRWMRITTKQPGYSWLLLGTHQMWGHLSSEEGPLGWQRCGELLALLGGVATCGGVYSLTRRLFDDRTATVAGGLAAIWPQGTHLSAQVLSDMPHLALYLLGLLLAYEAAIRPRLGRLALCGLVSGVAYLFRQEALGLAAGSVIGLWWIGSWASTRKKLTGVAVFGIGFAITVAPYAIIKGQIMPNKGLDDLFDTDQSPPAIRAAAWPLAHAIPVWQTPGRMLEAWGRSGRYVFSTLFVIGLFLKSMPRAERRGRWLLMIVAALHLLLVVARVGKYGEISSRYMIIPAVLCLPWAAAALRTVSAGLLHREWKGRYIAVAALWGAVLTPLAYYTAVPVNDGKQHYRMAGRWLARHAERDETILAHRNLEQILYYTNRTYPREHLWARFEPDTGLDGWDGIVAESGATWFVDVRGSRRGRIDESVWFAALFNNKVAGLHHEYSAGPEAGRAGVFRLVRE